jgi:hypothetical protein
LWRAASKYKTTVPNLLKPDKDEDVISTLLFNVVLEVIVRWANHKTTGTIYKRTQLLAYADDIDIVSRSQSAVRDAYLALEGEAAKVGLKINEQKTKWMHSNLASFKKPKIQFSQCLDAQTPNKPVSKQPTLKMPTFKTTQRQIAQLCIAPTHPKPKQPVSKQPKFKMPIFKTPSFKKPSFVVSRLVLNMRIKKYCSLIAEKFNMTMAFLAITQ